MLFYHFSIEITALILASYTWRRTAHTRITRTSHIVHNSHTQTQTQHREGNVAGNVVFHSHFVLANVEVDVLIRCDAKVYTIL